MISIQSTLSDKTLKLEHQNDTVHFFTGDKHL